MLKMLETSYLAVFPSRALTSRMMVTRVVVTRLAVSTIKVALTSRVETKVVVANGVIMLIPKKAPTSVPLRRNFMPQKFTKHFSKAQHIEHHSIMNPGNTDSPPSTSQNSKGNGAGNSYGQNAHTQETQQTSNRSST
uniref:Uncharacterized protein n=1 Tax=Pseudo-nitzschia australis TaxID=44445 RepID=A0A7S4AN53_9STRA